MGDNTFNIKITAVDNATKVVNKVNKSVDKIFRPYDNAKRSTKSFFDAIGKNALVAKPLAAFEKLGSSISAIGSTFGVAENSVLAGSARMATALGAIGGPIGGILAGTAAVVGGTAAVAVKMGELGFDVALVAKNLGVTTGKLQEYRAASQLAGLSTGSMDSSLAGLGTTLQDASAGRNLQAATLLSQMGVSIKRTKDGAVDTVQAFRDISEVISKISDPNIAKKMTDMLGLTESLPLLRQGTAALDTYIATAKKAGMVMTDELVQKNEQQAESWHKIKGAIDGIGISIGNTTAKYVDLEAVANSAERAADAFAKKSEEKSKPSFFGAAFRPALGAIAMGPYGVYQAVKSQWMDSGGAPEGSRSQSGKVTDLTGNPAVDSAGRVARGIRTNNPGNLRSWPGAGSSGGYATFATPEDGLKAAGRNLMGYQDKYGINTISKIINRWAPASDNNNVPAYVAAMSKSTGFGADQKLDLHDPKVLAPLISAITKHENGQNPYDADTIAKAAVAAVREAQGGTDGSSGAPINLVVHNAPPGMSIKAVRGLGQSTVGMTMAPGGAS